MQNLISSIELFAIPKHKNHIQTTLQSAKHLWLHSAIWTDGKKEVLSGFHRNFVKAKHWYPRLNGSNLRGYFKIANKRPQFLHHLTANWLRRMLWHGLTNCMWNILKCPQFSRTMPAFFSLVHVCSVHEVLTRCQISQGAFGNGETLVEVRVSWSCRKKWAAVVFWCRM